MNLLPTDAEVADLANEMLRDPVWLNTLEEHYAYLDSAKDTVRDTLCQGNKELISLASMLLVKNYEKAAYHHAKIVILQQRDMA